MCHILFYLVMWKDLVSEPSCQTTKVQTSLCWEAPRRSHMYVLWSKLTSHLTSLLTPSINCQSEEVSRCLLLPAVQSLLAESPNTPEKKQTIPLHSVQIPHPLTLWAQQNGQFTPRSLGWLLCSNNNENENGDSKRYVVFYMVILPEIAELGFEPRSGCTFSTALYLCPMMRFGES